MSIDALRAVLDGIEEPSCVAGTARPSERVAVALPDGDVGAVDDPKFVDWLLAHAELAPYGEGTETKRDKNVRNAQRLVARDRAEVHGFDPSAILDEIEAALSPGAHLSAHLTDVIVYPKGGKFARHKDTPRTMNLVGTLVVGLPIAHTGGAFVVDDGRSQQTFDWSKTPAGQLPWVALFTDVDHWIEPVKSGSRVTLVYALHRTDQPRTDATWTARRAAMRQAARSLAPRQWPLMIACGRHAVAEPGTKQPQPITTLRGLDRDLAEVLVEAGYRVGVRACIAPVANYDPEPVAPGTFPLVQNLWAVTRLKAVPPPEVMDALVDEGGYEIEEYILDSVPLDQWLVRKDAAATLAHESAEWAEPGSFGNEGFAAILYTLAAIEVTKGGPAKKPTAKAKKPAAKAKKPAAKKKPAKKKR
ncbi:MAG TPA: hypothetical protein VFQ53_29445 [Kofleriaceae bacterium]|nr:hypothetical protein [Kofleriaceae bacterium]